MAAVAAFDLIVIGGGSGGSGMARRAAGYGAKVALIDRGVQRGPDGKRIGSGIGGTCVNVGCVPKKLMFMAAQQREFMHGSSSIMKGYGYTIPEEATKYDWAGMKKRRDAYIARLNNNYLTNWKKAGIDVMVGTASFSGSNTVSISLNDGGSKEITAPHIVVACGGAPTEFEGYELAITSDGFFDIEEQPKKMAVLGGGYIAVEMAGIMHALGTSTDLFFRGETVLRRGFDPYIVGTLMDELKAHGPNLHGNKTISKIVKDDDGSFSIHTKDSAVFSGYDVVLSAIGRKPVTDLLQTDKAGIELDKTGHIVVDKFQNTNVPGIYALGDCANNGFELTPVAIAAGRRLGDRLFGGEPNARLEYKNIASVVFSHPPIGTIGLTEPAAREEFGDENVVVKQAKFPSMLYAMNDTPESKVKTGLKLVLAGPEETVVGLHCIGPFSDEMMQGFAVAVRMGATRADFEASVAIHPTVGEEFVTFGGWGQKRNADGDFKPMLPPYLREKSEVEQLRAEVKMLKSALADSGRKVTAI